MTVTEIKLTGALLLAFLLSLVAIAAFPPQPVVSTFGGCPPELSDS